MTDAHNEAGAQADPKEQQATASRRRMYMIVGAVAAAAIVATAIAVPVSISKSNSSSEPSSANQNLESGAQAGSNNNNPAATTTSPSKPTDGLPMEICDCRGGYVKGKCYKSLVNAFNDASATDAVTMVGTINSTETVYITKNTTLIGTTECPYAGPSTVVVTGPNATDVYNTLFRYVNQPGPNLSLRLKGIRFTGEQQRSACVARTEELGEDQTIDNAHSEWSNQSVNLFATNCTFENFITQARGGAVFWIDRVGKVEIKDSIFRDNAVDTLHQRYDGTGVIWIRQVPKDGVLSIANSSFINNHHMFSHGEGGAWGINQHEGKVETTNNKYMFNIASAGGAIYMEELAAGSSTVIEGEFSGNIAQEEGAEARGGAMWLKFIQGTVYVGGSFHNNSCPTDRGGAVANNWITSGASVTLGGSFTDNTCLMGASVWDTLNIFDGSFTLDEGSHFDGNRGVEDGTSVIRLIKNNIYVSEGDANGNALHYGQ